MALISHTSITLLLFLSFIPLSFSERCHPNDKKALLQIKKDLKNPNLLSSWKPETDCCAKWFGLICDLKTNRIIRFRISQSDLRLPIPAAVGDLPYLRDIQFYETNFTGEIPAAFSKLANLESLDLRSNLLTGPVPSFLGNLEKLGFIGLSFNSLTGSIPASLSQLPKLHSLFLNNNKLTGGIPESFGDFKKKNLFFFLSDNQLSGPIPRNLGSATFSWLSVSRNRLDGDLSSSMFGKNRSSFRLDFSWNSFEFDFTNVEIPDELRNLDLSNNKIYGSIPEGLTKIDLSSLDVSYNRLCGQIPAGGKLQGMDYRVFFHNKCLCGSPLPKCKLSQERGVLREIK